jgi:hypothetical protein
MSEQDGKIIYSLIAKGMIVLADYSSYTGTFDQTCKNFLKNVKPNSSAAVKSDDYTIYYINSNNITFLIFTDHQYPKVAAIACLEALKKDFENSSIDTSDVREDKCLQKELKPKIQLKFDYFNEHKESSGEAMDALKEQIQSMHEEILQDSGLLNERGDKMNTLDEKSEHLMGTSNTYYTSSKRVKRYELMKRIKYYAAIGCAILIIIYIIICIVCSPTFKC